MPSLLLTLCQRLAERSHDAHALAVLLGTIVIGGANTGQIQIQPHDPSIASAEIVTRDSTTEVLFVRLVLASPPPLKNLIAELGPYRQVQQTRWDQPLELAFHPEQPDLPRAITILVAVQPGAHGLDDGVVRAVTLRPD